MTAGIELIGVTKRFGENTIVEGIDLAASGSEFLVLVGASGCGKSKILRMIAGLESVTAGRITIKGRDVTCARPDERDIAMVFQNYALYPHMSVAENTSFALTLTTAPKDEIVRRVAEAARILGVEKPLERKPKALSGGQRQRVAMGRAIVREPSVFLFDEPLSNLDAKLRAQMRVELALLHKRLGKTTIYVTHDQVEAMTLADRIVILDRGVIQQLGTPNEVFNHPRNLFVAGFIGSPVMNLFRGVLADGGTVSLPAAGARWSGFSSFEIAYLDPAVRRNLWTTLKFAAVSVSAQMLLGIALALALEGNLRGMAFFRTLFILPMMVAPIAVGMTWRYPFDVRFGLINAALGVLGIAAKGCLADETLAFAAIIIADIWQWTPFVFVMVVAGLANVDSSVLEAARIDGARWWTLTMRVKLPMIARVLAITLVMRLIDAFRVLEVIYVLTFGCPGDPTEVLSLYIYKTTFIGQKLGAASAISMRLLLVVMLLTWLALPPLAFTFLAARQVISGLTAGAVKG